jgi:hypothetical protein
MLRENGRGGEGGIGIRASTILFWYRPEKMPNYVGLVQYRTRYYYFFFCTGLFECRTVWHVYTGTYTYEYTYNVRICTQYANVYLYGDVYVPYMNMCTYTFGIRICTYICIDIYYTVHIPINLVLGHGPGQWDLHVCRNSYQKLSPASLVFRQFTTLSLPSAFRHQHSGIIVSPVPLVTD